VVVYYNANSIVTDERVSIFDCLQKKEQENHVEKSIFLGVLFDWVNPVRKMSLVHISICKYHPSNKECLFVRYMVTFNWVDWKMRNLRAASRQQKYKCSNPIHWNRFLLHLMLMASKMSDRKPNTFICVTKYEFSPGRWKRYQINQIMIHPTIGPIPGYKKTKILPQKRSLNIVKNC
jgi:hypothetical protein